MKYHSKGYWVNSIESEHQYALFTLKGSALEVSTLKCARLNCLVHVRVWITPHLHIVSDCYFNSKAKSIHKIIVANKTFASTLALCHCFTFISTCAGLLFVALVVNKHENMLNENSVIYYFVYYIVIYYNVLHP